MPPLSGAFDAAPALVAGQRRRRVCDVVPLAAHSFRAHAYHTISGSVRIAKKHAASAGVTFEKYRRAPLARIRSSPPRSGDVPLSPTRLLDFWFVYVVRCGDGSLYTGIARDVEARIAVHETGRGARYTRSRGPFELCVTRRCASKTNALRLELAIKRLTRSQKEALLQDGRFAEFARAALRAASRKADRPSKRLEAQRAGRR
jgi:putative endonuclease